MLHFRGHRNEEVKKTAIAKSSLHRESVRQNQTAIYAADKAGQFRVWNDWNLLKRSNDFTQIILRHCAVLTG
jgi:hypothetical protein